MYLSMSTLNALASRAAVELGARCATDVTGFGLLGHAMHLARASDVRIVFDAASVPVLPGARESLAAGYIPGGARRNAEWVSPDVDWNDVGDDMRSMLTDPQTSGGLLVALDAAQVETFRIRVPSAIVVGVVERATDGVRIALA